MNKQEKKIRRAFKEKKWNAIKTTDSWQIFKIMSEFVDGVMMEFATIPSGLGIGLILFGNLFGIINIILAWKE